MAIFFQKQEKQKKKLALFFIVLILFIIYLVWLMFFQKEIEKEKGKEIEKEKEIRINFEVLKDLRTEKLEPFPDIEPIETGRENPFIPY